jgi:ATP-dependent RNA helicase DeaD
MLNMGFIEDIENILTHVPEQRRMLLFSATMPGPILNLAKKFMGEYDEVKVASKQQSATNVEQVFYEIYEKDKLRALHRLIETEPEFYALVFCRTRLGADRLATKLTDIGYEVEALHGDVTQAMRERILAKFKGGHATILVATDVAARGIDINSLSHVINFDMPDSPEAYVHRIGRTGRAGKTGKAISFVAPGEWRKLQMVQQVTKTTLERGHLPHGQEVIDMKRNAMKGKVFQATEGEISQDFYDLAADILGSGKPKQLLASLLQLHFGGHLNPHAYPEIREPERAGFKAKHSLERHGAPRASAPATRGGGFGGGSRRERPSSNGAFSGKPFFKKKKFA